MAHYVVLINWTDQGIRNVKEFPQRLAEARKAVEAAGGKLVATYMTMGQYDLVVIAEGPDDATVAAIMLAIASRGNVHTTTLKAFTEQEAIQILGKIP